MSADERAKTYLQAAIETYKVVQESNKRFVEKTKNAIWTASTLVPIVIGLGYFIIRETKPGWILYPIAFSSAILILAILLGVAIQFPTRYKYVDARKVFKKHKKQSFAYVTNRLASTWSNVANHNASAINGKETLLVVMYALIVIGIGVFAGSVLIFLNNVA
jgi:hypothetical protein